MTTDRDFDRLARAWLATGPDEAPDRAIAAVLQAAETTPQVRGLRRPFRRSVTMTRLSMAALLAVAILAAGGGILYIGSQRSASVVAPTPSAVPSAVPSATGEAAGDPVPPELQGTWVGPPRSIPDLFQTMRYRIQLTDQGFRMPDDNLTSAQLVSQASTVDAATIQLVTGSGISAGCDAGDTGHYAWSLSSSGLRLHLTEVDDACATRAAAAAGDWIRVGCKNPDSGCLGDLSEPGTFVSQYVAPRLPYDGSWRPDWGALTYTVPAGWANSADWPNHFTLTPSQAYAKEGPDGPADNISEIDVFRLPVAIGQDAGCTSPALPAVPATVDGLIGYLRGLKSVVATAPKGITIDGYTGQWVDVTMAPTWTKTCPDVPGGAPLAIMLGNGGPVGADTYSQGVMGSERERVIVLDVGGQVVAIVIDATNSFGTFVNRAMPIVQSFQFK